jgi:BolA family transcriptional regulator, general stress-responsive regulator
MISSKEVEKILKEKLEAVFVHIQDDGALHAGHQENNPAYYTVEVGSALFKGKSLIAQHRMVYDALKDELKEKIHALVIKTKVST